MQQQTAIKYRTTSLPFSLSFSFFPYFKIFNTRFVKNNAICSRSRHLLDAIIKTHQSRWIVNDSAQPFRKEKNFSFVRIENFPSIARRVTKRTTHHCIIPNPRLQREHEARISAYNVLEHSRRDLSSLSLCPPLRPTCITATLHACNFSCA